MKMRVTNKAIFILALIAFLPVTTVSAQQAIADSALNGMSVDQQNFGTATPYQPHFEAPDQQVSTQNPAGGLRDIFPTEVPPDIQAAYERACVLTYWHLAENFNTERDCGVNNAFKFINAGAMVCGLARNRRAQEALQAQARACQLLEGL